jgi:hypothetical protein
MLTKTTNLKGFEIRATDGELGTMGEFYFDDDTWAIRYLTVETGGWLGGREVLISPISVAYTDWQTKRLNVALTKKQVENSPDIDTHRPVSRQQEAAYLRYDGSPYYWGGPYLWGPAFCPAERATPGRASMDERADRIERVRWMDSKVYGGLTREAIKGAPEYVETAPITRAYENMLYHHYGRSYWLQQAQHEFSLSSSGA